MFKKTSIIILILILIAIFGLFVYLKQNKYITSDQAKDIVIKIINNSQKTDSSAYLWPQILPPGTVIKPWSADSEATGTSEVKLEDPSYLAWIDNDPGNIFFSHPTAFVYINAVSGEYSLAENDFWPVIDGQSFEGEQDTLVYGHLSDNPEISQNLRANILGKFTNTAQAASDGKRLHIEALPADETDQHKHYALIVAGRGKNAYAFLEGAQLMYQKLLDIGYDAAEISFLAPGRSTVERNWDGQGGVRLAPSDRVNGITSKANINRELKAIKEKAGPQDSLLVFIIAHGHKGISFALGDDGVEGSYNAMDLSKETLQSAKLCELMIVLDSCYSGGKQAYLEKTYDKTKIKRVAVAFSTNNNTISLGADYRDPEDPTKPAIYDLDLGAPKSQKKDANPNDRGGEFSSSLIEEMGREIFKNIYDAGLAKDAAHQNGLTHPVYWQAGESGSCLAVADDSNPPREETPGPTVSEPKTPEPATEEKPAEETQPAKKKIRVIKVNGKYVLAEQLEPVTEIKCGCCDTAHYHARNRKSVTALDGTVIPDPLSNCGYGKVFDMPIESIEDPR